MYVYITKKKKRINQKEALKKIINKTTLKKFHFLYLFYRVCAVRQK